MIRYVLTRRAATGDVGGKHEALQALSEMVYDNEMVYDKMYDSPEGLDCC